MNLADIVAADEAAVFLSLGEAAESVDVYPENPTVAGTHFTAVALFSDAPVTLQAMDGGLVTATQSKVLLKTSVIQAGMLAATGTSRDLRRGDEIRVTSGDNSGSWIVCENDISTGGNQEPTVLRERLRADSGQNREVR